MTAARAFAEWSLGLRDLPPEVSRSATVHLLDGLGTAVAAARADEVPFALAAAQGFGSSDEASVISSGSRLSAPAAALANGALVHALDYDDTHPSALVHPTSVVLPSAFAAGERAGATGADVLVAAVAGYETVIRLGAAVPHGLHDRGFHATSVCGVFAAALVASRLWGLDSKRTTDALGIAGSMAAGSLEFLATGSSTKQLHPGFAAMSGLLAARLAAEGAGGPASILEGDYGLFRSYTSTPVDASALTEGLGSRWETPRVEFKLHPVCQLSLASLDALSDALARAEGDVEQIAFEVPKEAVPIVCEPAAAKAAPRTPYEGKFSLPFCAALLAVDGRVDVGSFDRLDRPDVLALASRVTYTTRVHDGPPATAPGSVEVRTSRGSVTSSVIGPHEASETDVLDKFHADCGGRSGASQRVAELVLGLVDLPSVRPVLEATRDLRGEGAA